MNSVNPIISNGYQIAGIVIAVPVVLTCVWGIRRMVNHMHLVHEAIVGREATTFSAGIPSMQERFVAIEEHLTCLNEHLREQDEHLHQQDNHLANQDSRMRIIEAEFRTNGGSSLRDGLVKIQRQVELLTQAEALRRTRE